jgi:hypothetical protein
MVERIFFDKQSGKASKGRRFVLSRGLQGECGLRANVN